VQRRDPAGAGESDDVSGSGPPRPLDISVAPAAEAARAARVALADAFSGQVPGQVLADAQLLLSELVTNSVRHAGLPGAERVHVAAWMNEGRLRLEVRDAGASGTVAPREPDHRGGYGLQLVDTLAQRWGIIRGDGTRVWAELATDPRTS
jgi:anti-sigma regulatory factor (Ser/Thr protein kinase)